MTPSDKPLDKVDESSELPQEIKFHGSITSPDGDYAEGYFKLSSVGKEELEALLSTIKENVALETETRLRQEIAKQAPTCKHSLASEAEHKEWCGFVNNIWVNWAVAKARKGR